MRVLELLGDALVGNMPMLVIKRQALTRIFLALDFDGMGVVIPQNPLVAGRMQSQCVPNTVRNVLTCCNFPCINLQPIPVLLIDDLVMQV